MSHLLYNILLILASPLVVAMLLAKKRCRHGLPVRLGLGWARARAAEGPTDSPLVWVHAVSLGEVVAVTPLIQQLHGRHPKIRIVVSTVTDTGKEAVERRLAGIATHRYAPLDFPWAVAAAVRALRPSLYVFVETELWPNILRILAQFKVPTIMVNGRISSRSFVRKSRPVIHSLYRQLLKAVTFCLVQTDLDERRLVALGADPVKVRPVGNVKFDQPLPTASSAGQILSGKQLGLSDHDELIVAGSTHPKEEEELVACYQRLIEDFPALVLVIAPRHIERSAQVEAMVQSKGLSVLRRSRIRHEEGSMSGPRVIVLDTRGELAALYQFAALTFVGGTFVPVGGHNLLEPAVWGKPVFFGSHTDHCQEVADLLIHSGGGQQVSNGEHLADAMITLLQNRQLLQQRGVAAQRVVQENQGALQRCLEVIEGFLPNHDTTAPKVTKLELGILAGR